jgi:uncharacterized repeat protein (TIGR01451 family)
MPIVSGRLIFDRDREAVINPAFPGIPNVPIVLQNIETDVTLAVLTDNNGGFEFINVPAGSYQIVEYYGFEPAFTSPGDFLIQSSPETILNSGIVPPVSYVGAFNPPEGATNLDCLTPNTLLVTVGSENMTGNYILNGPVIYMPIETKMDSHVLLLNGNNLIAEADDGTFGRFPQGTSANTGIVPDNPYPGIGGGFEYVLPDPSKVTPLDGEFTIQNLMTRTYIADNYERWWRIADRDQGNETGRMMVINGDYPGAEFFRETITVKPNTHYLFSAWIINISKDETFVAPELGVLILDEGGGTLYSEVLGTQIPMNLDVPEWKQIGTVINPGDNESITVEFISMGPEAYGNDYAIDDITLYEIDFPDLEAVKTCNASSVHVGDTVTYTVTMENIFDNLITSLTFQDTVPAGMAFVPGSVRVNSVLEPALNPNTGFSLPDVNAGDTVVVTFDALVVSIPTINPTVNTATLGYTYILVEGGLPSTFSAATNPAEVDILDTVLSVVKKASPSIARPGAMLTYIVTVTNNSLLDADNVVLTDDPPAELLNLQYSTDGGVNWQPWHGSINLGIMANNTSMEILIQGLVDPNARRALVNTAIITSDMTDPVTSTITTRICGPRCQANIDLIESVALQETALSHILNAEGEKIQRMVSMSNVTVDELLKMNNSATKLVKSVTRLESVLLTKLELLN